MINITKQMVNSLDKVNILGKNFAVFTYKDGTEECVSMYNGERALLGMFKTDEKIVNKFMPKGREIPMESDFDLANAGFGESYFGNDGLIHIKRTASTDLVKARESLIHETLRGDSVNNPVLYALVLLSMISSKSKEGAVKNIDAELFLDRDNQSDILRAVTTYYYDFEEAKTIDEHDLDLLKGIFSQKKAEAIEKNAQQLLKKSNIDTFVEECLGI